MTPTVRGRRLPLSRLIITILVTVLLAPLATIAAGSAQAADRDADGIRHWRPWICTWADDAVDAKPTTIESAEGVIVLDENLLCWLAAPKEDTTDVPANPVLDSASAAFLNRTGMSLDAARESQLAAVLCHDGALGTSSLANGLPSVKEVTQACTKPTVPAGAAGFGDGSGRESGFLPDLFGAGAGMPSASSISCSAAGAANPWSDGVDGGTYQPKTSDGEIAGTLAASWFSGVAVIYGSAKGAGGATSTAGGVLAGGAGSAGIVAWGNGASSALGNLMDSRYRDQAQSLASDAQHWAQAAEANAQAAEGFAAASGDPNAAAEAAKARQAAEDAKKAAAEAAAAAKKAAEAKSRAEAAAAYAAAKKADEDAKKRADDASKAKQGAQNAANNSSGSGAPVNPGTSTGTGSGGSKGTTNGTPLTTGESACETLRREVAECEQSGWRSFSCQELARMISGCTLDPKIALVDSDGAVCGTPTVSTEEVISALRESCGMLVAHPMPGVDPCALTVEGSPEIRGGCDPTVAYGGCPDEPDVVVKDDDTVCFPAPPGGPLPPCVDPTPGGGPWVGGGPSVGGGLSVGGFLQDPAGGVYLATEGGIVALGQGYPPRP